MFAHRFSLACFYRNIYVSGNFDRIICVFYCIIYVLGNSPEIFITIVNVVPQLENCGCAPVSDAVSILNDLCQ
jgi:hypothetical protein